MKARDRRALWVLGLWAAGVGCYLGGQKAVSARRAWRDTQAKLEGASRLQAATAQELRVLSQERERLKGSIAKELQALTEDQLRLKGQSAILAAAEKAGLKGVRLRSEPLRPEATLRELRWTLEGEGALGQWIEAFQGIESALPLMGLQSFRIDNAGDPWGENALAAGPDGPSLKGGVLCSWVILTDSGDPSPAAKPLPAAPDGSGGRGPQTR